jgi:hypothetical protein
MADPTRLTELIFKIQELVKKEIPKDLTGKVGGEDPAVYALISQVYSNAVADTVESAVNLIRRYAKRIEAGRPFTVYLSGRIDGLSFEEASAQRLRVTKMLEKRGIAVRDPMRGKSFLRNLKEIRCDIPEVSEKFSMREITSRDLHDMRMSDAVLTLTGSDLSWGTQGEFWYMTFMEDKPTCVLCKQGPNGERVPSGWRDHYATKVVYSEDEAVEVLVLWAEHWDPVEVRAR